MTSPLPLPTVHAYQYVSEAWPNLTITLLHNLDNEFLAEWRVELDKRLRKLHESLYAEDTEGELPSHSVQPVKLVAILTELCNKTRIAKFLDNKIHGRHQGDSSYGVGFGLALAV